MPLLWVKASSESKTEGQQEEQFPSVKFTIQYLQPCMAAYVEKLVQVTKFLLFHIVIPLQSQGSHTQDFSCLSRRSFQC